MGYGWYEINARIGKLGNSDIKYQQKSINKYSYNIYCQQIYVKKIAIKKKQYLPFFIASSFMKNVVGIFYR